MTGQTRREEIADLVLTLLGENCEERKLSKVGKRKFKMVCGCFEAWPRWSLFSARTIKELIEWLTDTRNVFRDLNS